MSKASVLTLAGLLCTAGLPLQAVTLNYTLGNSVEPRLRFELYHRYRTDLRYWRV